MNRTQKYQFLIRIRQYSLSLIILLSLLSCDDETTPTTDPTAATSIPASGQVSATAIIGETIFSCGYLESEGIRSAYIWNELKQLKWITQYDESALFAICAMDTKWIAGGYATKGITRTAIIYSDEGVIELSSGSSDEIVYAVAHLASGNLLAAGYRTFGTKLQATSWLIQPDSSHKISTDSSILETILDTDSPVSGVKAIALKGDRIVFSGYFKDSSTELFFPVIWENGHSAIKLRTIGSTGGNQVPKSSAETLWFIDDDTLAASGFIRTTTTKWQSILWEFDKLTAEDTITGANELQLTDGTAASRSYSAILSGTDYYCSGYAKEEAEEWKGISWKIDITGSTPATGFSKSLWSSGEVEAIIYDLQDYKGQISGAGYIYGDIEKNILQPIPAFIYSNKTIELLDHSVATKID